MAQTVLQVDFLADSGCNQWQPVTAAKFNFDDFKQRPDMYLNLLRECAERSLPEGFTLIRLCYKDDDGDWCTLSEGIFEDAANFATQQSAEYFTLQLRIVSEKQTEPRKVAQSQAPSSSSSSSSSVVVAAPPEAGMIQVKLLVQCASGAWTCQGDVLVQACDALTQQDLFMSALDRHATEICPGYASLKYIDDEGEWCILSKSALADAFCLSTPVEHPNCPDMRQLCLRVVPHTSQPTQEDEAERCEETLLRELNKFGSDVDMRKLVPKLATAALQIVQDSQVPELFTLLDVLIALRDGDLQADSVPALLPQAVSAVLEVQSELRIDLLARFRAAAEVAVAELRSEQAKEKPMSVEVHVHVICDGCEMSPLVGARYKSLEQGDFDLCQECYDKEHRDPNCWVRVRSDVMGDVVGSYYGAGVAKERVHWNVICDGCGMNPIHGRRFKCLDLDDYDLCEECMEGSTRENQGRRFEEVEENAVAVAGAAVQGVEAAEAAKVAAQPESKACDKPSGSNDDVAAAAFAAIESLSADDLKRTLASLLQHEDGAIRAAVVSALPIHAPILSALEPLFGRSAGLPEDQASERAPTDGSWELTPEASLDEELPTPAPEEPESVPEPAKPEVARPSARVVGVAPLIVGIEVQEDVGARGDVTEELASLLANSGASQAFRMGRVGVPANTCTGDVPVCAKVVVVNNGAVPWPETSALTLVAGEALGFGHLPLGSMCPGDAAEIVMDLMLTPKEAPGTARSAWAIVDTALGEPLGPLLIFEAVWVAE